MTCYLAQRMDLNFEECVEQFLAQKMDMLK
jgi:hypothetical protein